MNTTQTARAGVTTLPRQETSVPFDIPAQGGAASAGQKVPQNVQQMLAQFSHLPAMSAILGMCEDGFPVLFDLMDDRPGPILITGDSDCGKTHLMKTILSSATRLNSPYEVKYALITANPAEWEEYRAVERGSHCFSFYGNYEDGAAQSILKLAEISEQRRTGREAGAAILLVVDDLRFIAREDYDVRQNFEWLLKNGPATQIWPVVSLRTEQALEMSRMVSYFRTRLIGHMQTGETKRLSLFDGLDSGKLATGKQFAVRIQDQWLKFWLPARI